MEMLPLFIYLAGIVDQVNGTMTFISAILLVSVFALTLYLIEQEKYNKVDPHIIEAGWKFWKKLIISLIICGTIGLLSPKDKTMYAIAGTYSAVQIAQSPESKVLIEKSFKVINQKLDEMLEPSKSKENK